MFGPQGSLLPAHTELLVNSGTYILENLSLTPLVEAGIQEFLLVLGIPKVLAMDQSLVNPIAIGVPSGDA